MCQRNPILLILFQEELSLQHYQHPHHAGRDHTGHHRSHQASLQRSSALLQIPGIQKCTCCTSTTLEDITRRFSKFNKLIRHCILQKIHQQLQTFQSQQANSHSDHTRSRPSSDLLCEDGTTKVLVHKK